MDQRTETHILCTSGGRNLVASEETAQLWSHICSKAVHTSAPNYHAVGAYMAIRGLLAKPNDFDTQSKINNQRIKVKTERGYQLSYTLLPRGHIHLTDIQIDFEDEIFEQGNKDKVLYEVSVDKEKSCGDDLKWITEKISLNELKLPPSSTTHIFISDSKIQDPKVASRYGAAVINSGHPEHKLSKNDTFYMFYRYEKKTFTGFFKLRRPDPVNKEAKFINEITSVIAGAASVCAKEYQFRQTKNKKTIQKIRKNKKANAEWTNPDLGNMSTKNQDKALGEQTSLTGKSKDLNALASNKKGLPDPVVCWTASGNGDKMFSRAVKKAARKVNVENVYGMGNSASSNNLNSHKLQHIFLNNYTVNDNRLDKAMAKIGMEWSSKRGTRSPVSLKNLLVDGFSSSEYSLLKRRTQVAVKVKEREQLHPAFSAGSKKERDNMLKSQAPAFSGHGAVATGLKTGLALSLGAFNAVRETGGKGEMEALANNAEKLAEKSVAAMNSNLGLLHKLEQIATGIMVENPSVAALTTAATAAGIIIATAVRAGVIQKVELLSVQRQTGDLSSMPTSELADVDKASAYRDHITT
ncbi:hypothetical protein ACJJIK_05060 [Microbulbifer sp. ZKSA006]|uniref:hypothetical protein n=1 Tax=Microbulbifer sp. ZKSA006 TaxID=3243390 RepID=UPI0040391CC6